MVPWIHPQNPTDLSLILYPAAVDPEREETRPRGIKTTIKPRPATTVITIGNRHRHRTNIKKNKQRPINHWTHRQKPSHPLQKSTQTLHPLHKSNQTHQPLHPPHKSMQISTTAGDVELRVGRRLWDRQVRVWELRGRVETDGEKERTNNILYEVRINFFIFYFFQLSAHSHIYNCTLYTYIIIIVALFL